MMMKNESNSLKRHEVFLIEWKINFYRQRRWCSGFFCRFQFIVDQSSSSSKKKFENLKFFLLNLLLLWLMDHNFFFRLTNLIWLPFLVPCKFGFIYHHQDSGGQSVIQPFSQSNWFGEEKINQNQFTQSWKKRKKIYQNWFFFSLSWCISINIFFKSFFFSRKKNFEPKNFIQFLFLPILRPHSVFFLLLTSYFEKFIGPFIDSKLVIILSIENDQERITSFLFSRGLFSQWCQRSK